MIDKIHELDNKRHDVLLNAALKEFAQKGYDDASTNVIAKEAHISKPLMFHYVGTKQDLFLYVYDYFTALLNSEYYQKIDHNEVDIINRIYQSFMLQIALSKKYPWIFDLNKLSALTKSNKINSELILRKKNRDTQCFSEGYDSFDATKFKSGLDIVACKHIILMACTGFSNQLLDDFKKTDASLLNRTDIENTCSTFFQALKHVFYHTIESE